MNSNTSISTGDIQAAIDAGLGLGFPNPIDDSGRFHSVVTPAGAEYHVIDLEELKDAFRDRPRRKTGKYTVNTVTSFIDYLAKHALPETELWADWQQSRVIAVINAHMGDTGDGFEDFAGWGDHRATLTLRKTPSWTAWIANNGKLLDQVPFAEHIENRLIDVLDPPGAELMEIAQSFHANRNVDYESGTRLSTGQLTFGYHEKTTAGAGPKGTTTIPEQITLRLQPYEGANFYDVPTRFRWRLVEQTLKLAYVIERPDDILQTAFTDIVDAITTETGRKVLHGTPPA